MFKNEDEDDECFLKSFLRREERSRKDDKYIDFPLDFFDTTMQNLTDMFLAEGKIESFKQNLKELKKLAKQFPKEILPLFRSKEAFPFLIEMLKTEDCEIQANSLKIVSELILNNHDSEDVVKIYQENDVYKYIMNFFVSEYLPLVIGVSKFFCYSLFASPQNFLEIFINEFLEEFFQIYKVLDKSDANSRVVFLICQIFYTLFELKIDVEILERVYQNILGDIYHSRFFYFFLQFVEAILQVTERKPFDSKDNIFLQVFFETDFPKNVRDIIIEYCFNQSDVSFRELNKSLSVLAELFDKNGFVCQRKEDEYYTNMFTSFEDNKMLLDSVYKLFFIDDKYEENGKKFNEEEEEKMHKKIDPSIFDDISFNSIRVFISLVKLFKSETVTQLSQFKIINLLNDHPSDLSYSKKTALTELCLTVLTYCSDDQFKIFISEVFENSLLLTALYNVDPFNENHFRALDTLICSIPKRANFSSVVLNKCHHHLVEIQSKIEECDPDAKNKGTNLTLLILRIEKDTDFSEFCEEGKISSDDDGDKFISNEEEEENI